MNPLAVLAALASSLCFAAAFVAQQHVAAAVPPERARGLWLYLQLARSGLWWAGFLGDVGGFAFQALALATGSIVLVQPFLVTAMVFALPLAARWNGRRIPRADLIWACFVVAALALFTVLAQPSVGLLRPGLGRWSGPGGAVLAVFVAALVAAWLTHGPRRATALGVATGLAYGLVAGLTDVVVHVLTGHGLADVFGAWETYALAIAILVGSAIQQAAFHAGPLAASLPATQVLEPMTGVLVGVAVFGASIQAVPWAWAVMAITAAVMVVGTVKLALSAARKPGAEALAPTPVRAQPVRLT